MNFKGENVDIFSLDVKNMYPSVDLPYVCDYIIDSIYKDPEKFFKPHVRESDDLCILYPPRNIFKKFFKDIVMKYTSFRSPCGFYRQKYGCSMGSKLSPLLSNIFLTIVERKVVTPLIMILSRVLLH